MNRNAMVLTLVAIVALLLVPPLSFSDSSGEAEQIGDSNVWICYGRNVAIQDRNYDESYSHIEWRYTRIQSELPTQDPVEEVVLRFTVPFEICKDDTVIQYYVRETATVSGSVMSEDLTVMINPSSYVRYVDFMYNDGTDTVYMHSPVTSERCYRYGDEYLVNVPSTDPIRPGYKFMGWYEDSACTTEYTKRTYRFFDDSHITRIYAKWIEDPTQYPGMEMVKIDLRPVDGLRFSYSGLVIPKGTDFSYTVSVLNLFNFDLSDVSSLSVYDNRPLDKSDVKYDIKGKITSLKFTLPDVEEDSLVILSNAGRLYTVHEDMHGVRITTGYENPTNKPLNLKMETIPGSGFNSIEASVWMNGKNITGNVVSGNWINIPEVTGDVYIFAYGVDVEKQEFPWWIIGVCAAAIALLLAALLLRGRRALVLSSSETSLDPVATADVGGKNVQALSITGDTPAFVMVKKGKECTRVGYEFKSEDLPEFLSMDSNGKITVKEGSTPAGAGIFKITAYSSDKAVCTKEFGYTYEPKLE